MIRAVVFDLDGVLIESERLWDKARREVVARHGGHWLEDATLAMQGMSAPEWSAYMSENLGLDLGRDELNRLVVQGLLERYERRLPLIPGAVETVRRIGRRWPLGLASSADRVVIVEVLRLAGLADAFRVTVSSEEVGHGKPAPDVYLEAALRLGTPPEACVAVEDSTNGIRSALAAGLKVVAVPNREYPPPDELLRRAGLVARRLSDVTVESIEPLGWPAT